MSATPCTPAHASTTVALRALLACAAAMGATGACLGATVAAPESFERVFATDGEPASLHFEVRYEDAKGSHRLEVWRDGSSRLRRSTDGMLDVLAERRTDDEVQLALVDHRRHLTTAVSRSSLYGVGHGLDWYSLAHGLERPTTAYAITRLASAPTAVEPASACRWVELSESGRRHAICWSRRWALPMLIVAQPGARVVWRVTSAQAGAVDPARFTVATPGYARVNADQDLKAD